MKLLLLLAALILSLSTNADVPPPLLNGEVDGHPASGMMERYFHEHAKAAFEAASARYEALDTPEDILAYQAEMRRFFTEQLGGFPERSPLNGRVVATGEQPLFRYEKIVFESLPGFYVTGILYLPKTQGPWPGIIVPCGHSANGKASEAYQRASMLLAANGMAAFCYDPIGQGERYAYLKADGQPEFGATLEHTLVGVGAILTGINTATYRIWDGMRAIDYLQSRADIDPDRIGCTGNSGGGTLTSYLMALDDRIFCAAPSCYLTTFDRLLHTIGPQDAEQNIFGQIAFGMDHADYIHQRAPKPTLLCAATRDFFDIEGTWTTFRKAKRIFTRLGYAERVDIVEHDAEHGFSQPLREAAARWMSRWLLAQDRVIVEPEFVVFSDEESLCTPDGQVMLLDGAVSPLDLNARRADALHAKRADFRNTVDDTAFRDQVRSLIGLGDADESTPEVTVVGTTVIAGFGAEQLLLYPESGIVLPAILARPGVVSGDYVVLCHEAGKDAVFQEEGIGRTLLEAGHAVLAVDLRGLGETANHAGAKGWKDQIGPDWQDYFFAYLLGKSYVGMRVEDIVAAATFIRNHRHYANQPVRLIATGQATVPALHAAALQPGLFDHVLLEGGIPSWSEVVMNPRAKHQLINAVHDALSWYDLPDLVALLPANSVTINKAHTPTF